MCNRTSNIAGEEENPMVIGEYYKEPRTDFQCENCETKWHYSDTYGKWTSHKTETDKTPWTESKKFCLNCIKEISTSDSALIAYYHEELENRKDSDIMTSALETEIRLNAGNCMVIFAELEKKDTECFAGHVYEYIKKNCWNEYEKWLMKAY